MKIAPREGVLAEQCCEIVLHVIIELCCVGSHFDALSVGIFFHLHQVSNIREEIEKLRGQLACKDKETAESIKTATDELQQKALKLFEVAYRKVKSQ